MVNMIKKAIYIILISFIGLFIGSSLFYRAIYKYYLYGDSPIFHKQNLGILLLLIIVLVLFSIVMYTLCSRLNKYSKKVVIPLILFISFAIQLAIIFLFTVVPSADSKTQLSLALRMLYFNDYSTFKTGGYLFMFPFNFPFVLYLKTILAIFPDNYLVLKIFNILFSLVTTLMIYLIYKEVYVKSKGNDYVILVFAATFVPSLFMSNYIYNDVISTTLLTSAIYFFIKFVKEKSMKHMIFAALLLSLGNYLRSVGVIILIAAVIYSLINLKIIGIKKIIISFCVLVVLFYIPNKAQDIILQKENIVSESIYENSAPIYLWLNMGINFERFGFFDHRQSYRIYEKQANYNKKRSTVLFKESIKHKLSSATLFDIAGMYYKKITWTWTEGTYQIDRYGIGNDISVNPYEMMYGLRGGYIYTTFASELMKENSKYRTALLWSVYVMNFLMNCFIFIKLITGIREKRYDEIFLVLVILGFIGFYILWEIKSIYIYPVYPLLIILSFMGFKDTYDFLIIRNIQSLRRR